MYTRREVAAIRDGGIRTLAELGKVDTNTATSLYNRLVRYAKRRFHWGEDSCNGIPACMLDWHRHEGELLDKLHDRLCKELEGYGLTMTLPGLYPWIDGARIIELVWY